MDFIRRVLASEPIILTRAITSVAAVAVAWGLPLAQVDIDNAVQVVVSALAFGNMLMALLDRHAVFAPDTHAAEVQAAYQAGLRDSLPD